jgi:DNA mismatch repair protein MutS2
MTDSVTWNVGDAVVVKALGRKRGVVVEAGGRGRYRVLVEGVTVWCRGEDLDAAPESGKAAAGKRRMADAAAPAAPEHAARRSERVDLHGLTVEQALARVTAAMDLALQHGADRLEVVHGKGSGRIRAALHRHLKTFRVVAAFRLDGANPGVTWVFFG